MSPEQSRQMRSLVAGVRDVLLTAKSVSVRGAEVLAGTEGESLMLDVETAISGFVDTNPAMVAARAAATEKM